jgi:hypothetical protein
VIQFATLAASPGYQGLVNPSQMLRTMAELLGINDRIEVADQQMVPMQAVQQMMMAGAAGAEQAGGAPPQEGMHQMPDGSMMANSAMPQGGM